MNGNGTGINGVVTTGAGGGGTVVIPGEPTQAVIIDQNGDAKGTIHLLVDENTGIVTVKTDLQFLVSSITDEKGWLQVNPQGQTVAIGDLSVENGTAITVNAADGNITGLASNDIIWQSTNRVRLEGDTSAIQTNGQGIALEFGADDMLRLNGQAGTSAQVLTSNGVNLPPTWTALVFAGSFADDAAAAAAGVPLGGIYEETITGYLKRRNT